MRPYTVMIREVVTTDRLVTIHATSHSDAFRLATRVAACSSEYKKGEISSIQVKSFPVDQ